MFYKCLNVSPEDLFDSTKYILVDKINYSNILSFIYPYIKPREKVMYSFYLVLLIEGVFWGYYSVKLFSSNIFTIWEYVGNTLLWMVLPFLLIIPVHEMIHGIAFKIMGAKKLTFGANIREMVFYVTADRFVLNKSMFIFLALTPFCIFTAFFIWFLFSSSFVVQWIGAMLLCLHTSCCIGDFALISYIGINVPRGKFYTFDDISVKTSYFFKKKSGF